ncbi:hypothetical protein ACIQFZ_34790 [Streptomyces sp. NPDC093064]|uniref:hypothetical protein n=1 Tax=Streptomyces sp. NPDC093064 TaxID=3366020 RepID=UPI003826980C
MSRTTPSRPLEVEALFPELSAYRGTTTRLHPRPGRPDAADSSVGGPLLWPADEPWPVCTESHSHARGRRPADIHRQRQILASAWLREPDSGPTDEERRLLEQLEQEHRVQEAAANDPLDVCSRIDAWEEALEEEAEQSADDDAAVPVGYQWGLHP